ncbi:autoinducer 2 sensor kinase/phosphatase luxQ, variant [Neurospora crassa OR74A]|uniref:histidine kinase n=1 Tax=Neurospora crassa (strain ATCC 24698 / 74-OR23-1A / CBS 708.71 / DSM 1257 / FGSC 987) TaxID=367110 RepID=V5IQK0_NEUCR|nr:autoinducer 2 sensor kinase/phosphatase luxQ, variant [Neurospora crassa OR74A]ESA43824.1 autoinducer 2 sensor kinase/phosphatase luxQ, variant [Neurospora crassa OR74A]|eukprot:XP_011392928.1 autoinducer 2 sensor kinase/phosphatase luxQ, variant [Neurospora crassa OR74A]
MGPGLRSSPDDNDNPVLQDEPRSARQETQLPQDPDMPSALPEGNSVSHPEPPSESLIDDRTTLSQGNSERLWRGPPSMTPQVRRSQSSSPLRLTMPFITPGQLAFSAMQFLPVPILVLDSLKTVVLANESMGRLLGMPSDATGEGDDLSSTMDQLRGQTLSQVGIDLIQDGMPVWIAWEHFLDQIALEMGVGNSGGKEILKSVLQTDPDGDATPRQAELPPSASTSSPRSRSTSAQSGDGVCDGDAGNTTCRPSPNAVVDVVIVKRDIARSTYHTRARSESSTFHAQAKMIISVWQLSPQQTFFTLTFTNTDSNINDPPSLTSSRDSRSRSPSFPLSPSAVAMSSSPFPPLGPPSHSSITSAPSMLQKITVMKDALLDKTQTPIIAMWKDGSVILPNKPARRLSYPDPVQGAPHEGFNLLSQWRMWTDDFSRQLETDEYPISLMIKSETPFESFRVGMLGPDDERLIFDVEGAVIRDEITGELLAGVITCRDITRIEHEISQIKAADEERFRLICETMPQLVWTAGPDGAHDFYNSRWYSYTGLSVEASLGGGWRTAFHPDDLAEADKRWQNSTRTGEPYVIEYRCRSKDGEWRWFLGRALPLKNKQTGEIEKWFGTCTDVHETMEAKLEAKRTRQQLRSVIAHSRMTMFAVDPNRKVTLLEGSLIWDALSPECGSSSWFIGKDVYEVFNNINQQLPDGQTPAFLQPLESILGGKSPVELQDHKFAGRWYRTGFQPILRRDPLTGNSTEDFIEGVMGFIMDVTELKDRERDIEAQALEKRQLLANEAAAKEASRLKSQFLANMSHEIRTPITGVIGMAELLLDVELDAEQRELTENIFRSANALLTVINDILDFSKIESGRLDIEEVQFSLAVVIQEVGKMLSFTAERKSLAFNYEICSDIGIDLVVMGDPGRVRQIITNLATNSIKFTHEGHVKLHVSVEQETDDTIEVKFVIQDTGIGIEEEVLKRLFQPFSQGDPSTARKFGGTGLGLTISKNLLELMKGRMALASKKDEGTTATFWIPFKKPQKAQSITGPLSDRLQSETSVSCNCPAPADQESGALSGEQRSAWRQSSTSLSPTTSQEELSMPDRSKIFILVVEDNEINQQIAIRTIRKLGFQVAAAWNGKEALEYLSKASTGKTRKPDIILMDVQMPLIDGYLCTHLLRHHAPYRSYVRDVPIVAMTASAIQGDKEKCKRAGMDDYLSKPVKRTTLERMLLRWCTTKREELSPITSQCTESGEHCQSAGIPAVGLNEEPSELDLNAYDNVDDHEGSNLATPMGPGRVAEGMSPGGGAEIEQSPTAGYFSSGSGSGHGVPDATKPTGDPGEQTGLGQAEQLLDASSQHYPSQPSVADMTTSPASIERREGEALTEENLGKLQEEQNEELQSI